MSINGCRAGLEVPAEPRLPDGSVPLPSRPNRTAILRIDRTISEIAPAFAGLRLLENALDTAVERARRRPGSAGTGSPMTPSAPQPGTSAWARGTPYAPLEPHAPYATTT